MAMRVAKRLNPLWQLYVAQRAVCLLLSMSNMPDMADPDDEVQVNSYRREWVFAMRLSPVWHPPTVLVSESLILNIFFDQLFDQHLESMNEIKSLSLSDPLPPGLLEYHLFAQNLQHKKAGGESLEALRLDAVDLLLKHGGCDREARISFP